MSEARQPLLPEDWVIIPGGMSEELVTSLDEGENETAPEAETPTIAKEIGEVAVKRRRRVNEVETPLPEGGMQSITLNPFNRVWKGSATPSLSGINVVDVRLHDDGEIRAANAIRSFMKVKGGRVAEASLIERLTNAGFGEAKAHAYIKQACEAGILVKSESGTFYRSAG